MTKAILIDLEEDGAREVAFRMALSMYLGERCRFCEKVYETLDDLKDTVFAGYHEHGRLACKPCWKEHGSTLVGPQRPDEQP